jgi:hypothetical protein
MPRYQIVHATVHAAVAALLYVFLRYVAVIDQYAYADWIRAGAILLLPFLFSRSTFIANLLVESIPGLSCGLRRMLSGKDFIEGDWPLVVMEADHRTLKYLGFLSIGYKGGQHIVEGDDWNPDGSHALHYRSQQSTYASRLLQYWYAQGPNPHQPDQFGYTRIYFFPRRGRIERHAGEFLDKEHKHPPFYARRIRYRLFQRRVTSDKDRLEAAKALWQDIGPKVSAMPGPRIDRDFL